MKRQMTCTRVRRSGFTFVHGAVLLCWLVLPGGGAFADPGEAPGAAVTVGMTRDAQGGRARYVNPISGLVTERTREGDGPSRMSGSIERRAPGAAPGASGKAPASVGTPLPRQPAGRQSGIGRSRVAEYTIRLRSATSEQLALARGAGMPESGPAPGYYNVSPEVLKRLDAAGVGYAIAGGVTEFTVLPAAPSSVPTGAEEPPAAMSGGDGSAAGMAFSSATAAVGFDEGPSSGVAGDGAEPLGAGMIEMLSGPVNMYVEDNTGYGQVFSMQVSSAPPGSKVSQLQYRTRISDEGNGSFYCGDYEVWLYSGEPDWEALVYGNLGGVTDGGWDDDPENDADIYLNWRTTHAFDGQDPNQAWGIVCFDNQDGDDGKMDYAEFRVSWLYDDGLHDFAAVDCYVASPSDVLTPLAVVTEGYGVKICFKYTYAGPGASATTRMQLDANPAVSGSSAFTMGTWVTSFDWTATAGTHRIQGWCDDAGAVAETNEANNQRDENPAFTTGPGHDFAAVDCYASSPGNVFAPLTTVIEGQAVRICFKYTYAGPGALATTRIQFDGYPGESSMGVFTPNTWVSYLDWKAVAGVHRIQGWCDHDGEVTEINEGNNDRDENPAFTVGPGHDFAALDCYASSPGDVFTPLATLVTGQAVKVCFRYAYTGPGTTAATRMQLDANPAVTASSAFTANTWVSHFDWTAVVGAHRIQGWCDHGGVVTETNEVNNYRDENPAFTVAPGVTPDIRVAPLALAFADGPSAAASARDGAAGPARASVPGTTRALELSNPAAKLGDVAPDEIVVRFREAEAAALHSRRLAGLQWDASTIQTIPARAGVPPLPAPALGVRPFRSGTATLARLMKSPKLAGIPVSKASPLTEAQMAEIAARVAEASDPRGPLGLFYVKVPPGTDLRAYCLELMTRADVVYAHPSPVCRAESVPNDALFDRMWNLARIRVPEAWDISGNALGEVRVCVVDTGVRITHQELNGRTADPADVYLANGDAYADADPGNDDPGGHGTACAGIIGALRDNGALVAGMAPITIIPVNGYVDGRIGNYFDGVFWGVDHGADVISLSLGSHHSAAYQVELDAAAYAEAHGVIVCAAAGNDDGNADDHFPSAIPYYISVGATDDDDVRVSAPKWWWGSNFGNTVDVCAPGQGRMGSNLDSILTLGSDSDIDWTKDFNGTSSATPQVAALCALIKHVNPSLGVAQIRNIVESTAEDQVGDPDEDVPGWDPYHGHGLVDAFAAISLAKGAFVVHNDGGVTLSVSAITPESAAPWIAWSPTPPFEVLPGRSQAVSVSVNFAAAPPGQTTRRLLIQSNDPDESPYPGGVDVSVNRTQTSSTVVTVSASDASAGEPSNPGTFTFHRTGATSEPLTVNFTVGGTATSGNDYAALESSVTFLAGVAITHKTLSVIDDGLMEPAETVVVTLADDAVGYTVGASSAATVTITDDDAPVPGLIAHWPMDEGTGSTAWDASGGGRPGTLNGGSTWTTGQVGAGAVQFDGTTGRMTFAPLGLSDTYTVALWILPVASSDAHGTLLAQGNQKGLWYQGDSRKLRMFPASGGSLTAITEGRWHHVAVVCNAGQVTYYLDGLPDGMASGGEGLLLDTLGDDPSSETFKGSLDEVRVYNVALSAASVKALAGPVPDGLAGYWPMDEGTGTTAIDTSGWGRTGTLGGGTGWSVGRVGGGALSFDGVNGRMNIPGLPLKSSHSVALWVNPEAGSDSYGTLLAEGNQRGLWYLGTSRQARFYPSSAGSLGALTVGRWHHVAVVCNGGQIAYYLDGVASGTATGGVPFVADTLGDDPASETFKGRLDEVRVYHRALSSAEVTRLAEEQAPITVAVAASDPAAGEPSNPGTFTFTRTGSTAGPLTVNFTVGGAATSGSDYAALGTSVTFLAGTTTTNKTMTVIDDNFVEAAETVVVTLASGTGYTIDNPRTATVTIADDDVPAPGLIALWPMNEGTGTAAGDASGGGRPGTLNGGASWTTGQVGSGAVNFDGSTGRMTFAPLTLSDTYSVAMWIRPVASSDAFGTLFSQGNQKGLWYLGGTRRLRMYPASAPSVTAITEGQWHHVAVVCNAGQVTYFLDGLPDGTATGAGGFLADSLGDDPSSETFKGALDEVRVYNHALSAGAVKALAGPVSDGLVGYWPMDEGTGTTTADASGWGRPGTLGGGSTWSAGRVGARALTFDGLNGRLNFSGLPLKSSYSIALWVNPEAGSDSYGTLLAEGNQKGLWYLGGSRQVRFFPSSAGSVGALTMGRWQHVAMVCNAGLLTYFIDGVASGTATGGVPFVPDSVGDDSASETFKGRLDDLRVYDRVLNAAEVTRLASEPEPATVTVTASDAAAGEPSNPGTFTFTRTGATTGPLTVNFAVTGTATSGTDYATLGNSVTFLAGVTITNKTVTVTGDNLVEAAETVVLTLATGTGYALGDPSTATVTIADDDVPAPGLIAHWPMDDGAGTAVRDASGKGRPGTLTGGSTWIAGQVGAGAVHVDGATGRMTFAPLTLTDTYTVALWIHPVASSDAYGTLFAQGNTKGLWYQGGTRRLRMIPASAGSRTAITEGRWHHVAVVCSAGQLTYYLDGLPDGTASGAAGFLADTLGDDPSSESFKGALDEVRVYNEALSAAAVKALAGPVPEGLVGYWPMDDGTGPTAFDASGWGRFGTLGGGSAWGVGRVGTGALSFDGVNGRMNLAGLPLKSSYSVALWVNPEAGSDSYGTLLSEGNRRGLWYLGASRQVRFYPSSAGSLGALTVGRWQHVAMVCNGGQIAYYLNGVPSGTATGGVPFVADSVGDDSASETFKGRLDDLRVYDRALSSAEVTRLADEPEPITVTVADGDAAAGEPSNPGTFTFTRTGSTAGPLTVNFTVGGTATSGSDYAALGTSVTFLAGATTTNKTLTVIDDALVEAAETVVVTLATGIGYAVESPSSATVTITDDDVTVSVSASDATAGEPSEPGMFTFTRSGAASGTLTVNFVVTGTATGGSDYAALGSRVTFLAGATSTNKALSVIDDDLMEAAETVVVTLAAGTGYAGGNPSAATVTIADDDATVSVAATDAVAGEPSNPGTFTFSRTGATSRPLTVNFAVTGTATGGSDYVSLGSSVSFLAGATTTNKTLTVIDDALVEAPETVVLTLAAGTGYAVGSLSAATVTISDDDVPAPGLVVHWPMDEGFGTTVGDVAGGGRHGTLGGGSTWTAGRVGSGAVNFDGTAGRMTFAPVGLTDTYSIALWMHPVASSDAFGTLFSQGSGKGLWYQGGTRKLRMFPASGGSLTAITEERWHHVAVVCDAGQVTYYLDGLPDGTASGAGGFLADTLGDDPASETFKGALDEVRVYNYALGAAAVKALAGPVSEGLVGYWPMDEGSGPTAFDASGWGRSGTLGVGSAWSPGRVGSGALSFDGLTGRLNIPGLPLKTSYSVALWVNPEAGSDGYGTLLAEGNQRGLWYLGTSRQVRFYPSSAGSLGVLTVGRWHHVAVVCDAGQIAYYLDGVASGTATGGVPFVADTLGDDPASETFKGRLDDVRAYNRALSSAEVTKLAGMTATGTLATTSATDVARTRNATEGARRLAGDGSIDDEPVSLLVVGVMSDGIRLVPRGGGGRSYAIEASVDLIDWVRLTNSVRGGAGPFTVPRDALWRFYRLVRVPGTE